MSFCSVEEAWGSPYTPTHQVEVQSAKQDIQAIDLATNNSVQNKDSSYNTNINTHNESEVNHTNNGMVREAPLKGSLLGSSIPHDVWQTNEPKINSEKKISDNYGKKYQDLGDIIASKIDSKFEALFNRIDKYLGSISSKFNGNNSYDTCWSDVLIFISIGIITIILLDMFFKFGKWFIDNKSKNSLNIPSINNYMNPQQASYQNFLNNLNNTHPITSMNHPIHSNPYNNISIPPPNF